MSFCFRRLLVSVACVGLSTSWAIAANVRDFGAKGDGVSDDTTAIQAAIDASANGKANERGEVVIPAGNYLVSKTLTVEHAVGLSIRGAGNSGYIEPKFGAGSGSPTCLIWTGARGGVLLDTVGVTGVCLEKLVLCGKDPSKPDSARAGTLVRIRSVDGWGNTVNHYSDLSLMHADAGIVAAGERRGSMNSDFLFYNLTFFLLGDGFRVENEQGVDYTFNFVFALGCDRVLAFEEGGNVVLNSAQMTNCKLFCDIVGGGRNSGTYVFNNVRVEDSEGGVKQRRQVLRCKPKNLQAVVTFNGFNDAQWDWNSNKTGQRSRKLCEIGPGSLVVFNGSIFNSSVAEVEGTKANPASLIIRESSFGFITPAEAIKGGVFARYKIVDCFDDQMRPMPDLISWPRGN